MKLFLFITTCLFCLNLQAQTDSTNKNTEDVVFTYVSTYPVFSGGDDLKFVQYVISYVKENTPQLKDSVITGKAYVHFFVETDGSVSGTSIVPGKGIKPVIDQAIVDAVKKTRWTPGTENGKIVRVKRAIPIKFN